MDFERSKTTEIYEATSKLTGNNSLLHLEKMLNYPNGLQNTKISGALVQNDINHSNSPKWC